jgi:Fic family protein
VNEKDFTSKKSGELVKIPEGVLAFVPNPLPPDIPPTWELAQLNSEADRALSELGGLARMLPNAHLLSGSFRRREAVLSSRIEGTVTTMSELFLFEAGGEEQSGSDVREVHNYVRALDFGLKQLSSLPVCNRLIKDVHRVLMTGVRGGDKTPGEFRKGQNYIGSNPATSIQDATYVPPPPKPMLQCMEALEDFINAAPTLPPLVRQALIHYQFEAIHPFQDGNGRIGRLLLTLDLCSEKIVDHPLLYVSEYIEKRRDEYYGLLYAVSTESAWEPWIEFFLRAVSAQARDAQIRARRLHDLMQEHRERLITARAQSGAFKVLDALYSVPAITSVTITNLVGGNTKTGQRTIDRLERVGILKEIQTGRIRNKLYMAEEVNKIVAS